MKKVVVFILIFLSAYATKAKKVSGYFVRNNNDTIQATFKLRKNMHGDLKIKSIRKSMWFASDDIKSGIIVPQEVKFVKVNDTAFGEYDIYPLQIEKKFIFALGLVKGKLSVYRSERDNVAWVINKYSSPTDVIFYVQLQGRPLAVSSITPFDNRFWIYYLGKQYAEFTNCLRWEGKKKRKMRREGTPCFWEGKSLAEIANLFNEKYTD